MNEVNGAFHAMNKEHSDAVNRMEDSAEEPRDVVLACST
jgi:murein tripeptide amidase MpaA